MSPEQHPELHADLIVQKPRRGGTLSGPKAFTSVMPGCSLDEGLKLLVQRRVGQMIGVVTDGFLGEAY